VEVEKIRALQQIINILLVSSSFILQKEYYFSFIAMFFSLYYALIKCIFSNFAFVNMSNDYFQFKKFIIRQDKCAMKVGTDGTLLGAWASAKEGYCRILDIGTGTGLIGLMMAQRFPDASVVCIDIDNDAITQAHENIQASPFNKQVLARKQDITLMDDSQGFDAIVCNPPFYENSLSCMNEKRTKARHTICLNYQQLTSCVFRLLFPNGKFSVIIPSNLYSIFETNAILNGLFVTRICKVHSTINKPPKRHLIEFMKVPAKEVVIEDCVITDEYNKKSNWYQNLTNDFYIR